MSPPLTFFVGCVSSFNVRRLVKNLGWMLSGSDEVHLITTDPAAFEGEGHECFKLFGGEFDSSVRGEIRALKTYLRAHDPAVLTQLTHPPTHGTMVGLAAKRFGVPFVYRYSGDRFYEYRVASGKQKLTGFALGNVLGRVPLSLADQCLVLGPRGRDRLTNRGVSGDAITRLPPSVHAERFREPGDGTPVCVPGGREVILFVGRISRLKGSGTLRATLPQILDDRDDLQLVFVGAEEERLSLSASDADHVTVVGPVDPAEMPAYYQQASLLIHPSLTEGVPRAVLESLAAGTPVLVRDVGDVTSVTENTFVRDDEFVDSVRSFEDLPLDDVRPFTRESLAPAYADFFESFR